MSLRVRRTSESAKSFPSCLRRDRSQSSFPCSRVREQRLPDCFFQVCASSLFLLGKEIVSHNFQRKERFVVVIGVIRHYTGAADKAVNLVGCKSPHHQWPGQVVSISDACGGNEACSART